MSKVDQSIDYKYIEGTKIIGNYQNDSMVLRPYETRMYKLR